MSDHPTVFGFGLNNTPDPDYPMTFSKHVIVGANPHTPDGTSATEEEAMRYFCSQFKELAHEAKHKFLFVRRAPEMQRERLLYSDTTRYCMIGRFGVADIKEKNT